MPMDEKWFIEILTYTANWYSFPILEKRLKKIKCIGLSGLLEMRSNRLTPTLDPPAFHSPHAMERMI